MDTIKILLGATVALLLGALAISFKNTGGGGQSSATAEELAAVKRQLAELQLEQERIETARQRRVMEDAVAQAPPIPQPVPTADMEAMKAQLAELQAEKERAERDAETANREAAFVGGKMLENRDSEQRRARMIADALLIGRVKEWVEDPNLGGFAVIDVLMPDNVQPGAIVCIRRNTGILGKLRVGEMTIEGAIGSPVSSFNEARPQSGDELILEPPF